MPVKDKHRRRQIRRRSQAKRASEILANGTCTICKQRPHDSDTNYCAECRERRNADQKRIKWRRKMLVLSHYSGGTIACSCCGEKELLLLTVDHPNGGGAEHRKSDTGNGNFYHRLIRDGFPNGLRVLCFNCNIGIGLNRRMFGINECPHVRPGRYTEEKQ